MLFYHDNNYERRFPAKNDKQYWTGVLTSNIRLALIYPEADTMDQIEYARATKRR